jgi:hypothetical protein
MTIEYNNFFSFQGPPNFTQNWIFGLKTYRLASLLLSMENFQYGFK